MNWPARWTGLKMVFRNSCIRGSWHEETSWENRETLAVTAHHCLSKPYADSKSWQGKQCQHNVNRRSLLFWLFSNRWPFLTNVFAATKLELVLNGLPLLITVSETYLLCDHAKFFKVDHSVNFTVVAQMNKGQIFLDHRIKGNYRRLDIIRIYQVPVATHVARRVH